MPATDKTVRDIKKVHVVFAVTSVILVLSTVWMFWKDHARPWKEYQKEARAIDLKVSEWRLMETETANILARLEVAKTTLENAQSSTTDGVDVINEFIDFLGKTESLQVVPGDPEGSHAQELEGIITAGFVDKLEVAKSTWQATADKELEDKMEARAAMALALSEAVRLLKAKEDKILSDTKFKRANRDETASQLGIAFDSDASDEDKAVLEQKLDSILRDPVNGLDAYELKYQKATYFRRQLAAIGNKFQSSVRVAEKALE